MGLMLSSDEVQELTGYKFAKHQVEWLRARGWCFELDRLDRPKVDREYYRQRMGNVLSSGPDSLIEPNWAAMDAIATGRPRSQ